MTPSEKEKIIKEGFDAIRKVYNLRDDLLSDADKLEAARESNRKLSDRVANLEVTIKALDSAIDKKDVEIQRLREELDLLKKAHAKLCGDYDKLHKAMIAEVMGYATHDADEEIKSLREELELLRKVHAKLCCKYNTLCENNAKLEDNFHELRRRFSNLYSYQVHDVLETKDMIAFSDWIKNTFGDFGIYDEEE